MIDRRSNPVGWAMLTYELADAHEHLGNLLKSMQDDPTFDEMDFRIQLGHVYAHLNRGWFHRNVPDTLDEADWEVASRYPSDLEPIG